MGQREKVLAVTNSEQLDCQGEEKASVGLGNLSLNINSQDHS